MKGKYFVAMGLALTKLGLFEVRGIEADRLHEGVSAYVGVKYVCAELFADLGREGARVCANVDSMGGFNHCFLPDHFYYGAAERGWGRS